jgi:hypothetical protein
MRIRSWQAVAPLVAVLLALLLNMPPANGRPLEGQAAGKNLHGGARGLFQVGGDGCLNKVCPVFLMGYFGGYYEYYALLCTGNPNANYPVLLEDTDFLTPMPPFCTDGNCTSCVDVPEEVMRPDGLKKADRLPQHIARNLSGGWDKQIGKAPPDLEHPEKSGTGTTLVGPPRLIDLEVSKAPARRAKVLLYLMNADPAKATIKGYKGPKLMPRLFATGIEVDDKYVKGDAEKVPYENIVKKYEKAPGILQVRLGSAVYQVILKKSKKE